MILFTRKFAICMLALISLLFVNTVAAEEQLSPAEQETKAALIEAVKVMKTGPATVPLTGQAKLNLPAGFGFIPKAQAERFMMAMGNKVGNGFQGLIMPNGENSEWWFMSVTYHPEGYIKDDDAKDWDADELLASLKEGTKASNKERTARGIPAIEVVGWVEKPTYDAANHRLVWSVAINEGLSSSGEQSVNYNTLMLGREGFISMNLVTGMNSVEGLKPVAKSLLASLEFDQGKRYADFNESTDKVAEYGLAALVAGAAAKKLGLFGLLAAFAAKSAKVLILAAIAGLSSLGKLFKSKTA